jgi:cytochrome c-type biogenesis protein CcmF
VFSEWVRGTKITVGPPFFNNINVPIGLLLLFLTGVGPLFAWRKTSLKSLRRSFFRPVIFSIAACVALLAGGMRNFYAVACLTLCAFVLVTVLEEFVKGALVRTRKKGENFFSAVVRLTLKNKRRYGGYVVHVSIVLMFIGFTGNVFNKETTRQLQTGQSLQVGDYSLKMTGYLQGQTPNYEYGRVSLDVYKGGKVVRSLMPERRIFKTGSGQMTTKVALRSTPREDLYVVLSGVSADGSTCEIKAHVNPLVYWIWVGAAIMILGTVITLLPNKKTVARSQEKV